MHELDMSKWRKVIVRMTVEYEVSVPADWDRNMIEFHRNDGSWCADNAISELEAISDEDNCLCPITKFEYVKESNPIDATTVQKPKRIVDRIVDRGLRKD